MVLRVDLRFGHGGVEIQPMNQERRHGGGQPGGASVTGSPDSGGSHALIGAIDTVLPLQYCSAPPKKGVYFFLFSKTALIYTHVLNRGGKGVRSPADGLMVANP